jgi:protein-disulfide isomerase
MIPLTRTAVEVAMPQLERLTAGANLLTAAGLAATLVGSGLAAADDAAEHAARSAGAELSEAERQRELAKLMQIVAARQNPLQDADLRLRLNGNPDLGDVDARLVIAEFSSYRCGFCRRHFVETMPRIVTDLIDPGLVRYVFFDYAVDSSHPPDRDAAGVARCAAEQGRYWTMREHLFQRVGTPLQKRLPPHAVVPGLDGDALAECTKTDQGAAAVSQDLRQAMALGVRGTPSFLMGYPSTDGSEVRVVKRIVGAQPYAVFAEVVDALLSEAP